MTEMPPMVLSERLRRGIEEDILAGRLLPGDPIDERSLAARFAVSRTPVREALLQLSMLGLVSMRPRQRMRVASIGLPKLLQMMEMLSGLEAQIARLAARRMSEAQRQELLRLQQDAAEVVARNDAAAFNEMNWCLHLAIFAGSQNGFMADQARTLRLRLHPYRCYLVRLAGRMRGAHEEHEAIVAAIVAGEADAAFERMAAHLTLDADRMSDLVALMPATREDEVPQAEAV